MKGCLSIKVAMKDGAGLKNEEQVRAIIDKVNEIWGCTEPGQCCIRFDVVEVKDSDKVHLKPQLAETFCTFDFDDIAEAERHPDCYNMYLVEEIDPPRFAGMCRHDSKKSSVISTSSGGQTFTDEKIAQIAAHELGHAMGLARNDGTEAGGVDRHSSTATNLMSPSIAGTTGALNAEQCAEAQRRGQLTGVLTPTDEDCTMAPQED